MSKLWGRVNMDLGFTLIIGIFILLIVAGWGAICYLKGYKKGVEDGIIHYEMQDIINRIKELKRDLEKAKELDECS